MADIATQRIKKELKDMSNADDFEPHILSVELVNNSLFNMIAEIAGPPDTPYANGKFRIDLKIPPKYPFRPPKVSFITKIWHPNISSRTGAICLDILANNWAASLTIKGVLLSLQSLLQDPEPESPLDAMVAHQYKCNRDLFNRTARYWTATYALPDSNLRLEYAEFESKLKEIKVLAPKDATDDQLISALSAHGWQIDRALKALI